MNLLKPINYFLDRITMYRLVLYLLLCILGAACLLSLFSIIEFSPVTIIFSLVLFVSFCWVSNKIFSNIFHAPTNIESAIITGLILACIVNPPQTANDIAFICLVSIVSMASKYVFNIENKHLFNPAAIALTLTGIVVGKGASWWVGTLWLSPIVAISGFLIIRKLRFQDMAWAFFSTFIIASLGIALSKNGNILTTLSQVLFHSSMLYLGSIMLTEPLTLPPTKNLQMIYGGLVGLLSVPQFHVGDLYFAPELALSIGNLFAYLVSPKEKLMLYLDQKLQIAPDIYDFVFKPISPLSYSPGQYMEWTLSHPHTDNRGNRRYFTLASSPTEDTLRLGVKFYEYGSTYKNAMMRMDHTVPIIGAQLAGDFTLPKNKNKKLVFIAGGIGITPYRSMIKYLLDKKEKRNIILVYSNKNESEIVYKNVFDRAAQEIGITVLYTLTQKESISSGWNGLIGRIDKEMIEKNIPDYKKRIFYISGPQAQIDSIKSNLLDLTVPSSQIKTDYFPGLI